MSITLKTLEVAKKNPPGKTLFAISGFSDDLTGCEAVKDAPSSGAIYVEKLHVAIDLDGHVDIGSGENSGEVETIALQLVGTATGLVHDIDFKHAIKLVDEKALTIDASAAGNVSILAEGFTSP